MNFRRMLCAAIVLTIVLSIMLPSTVLLWKTSLQSCRIIKTTFCMKEHSTKVFAFRGILAKTVEENVISLLLMFQESLEQSFPLDSN